MAIQMYKFLLLIVVLTSSSNGFYIDPRFKNNLPKAISKTENDNWDNIKQESSNNLVIPIDYKELNSFVELYRSLVVQLQMIKTTLNFELSNKSKANGKMLKRPRRKVDLKTVGDLPSDQIDDLMQVFNKKYGLDLVDDSDSLEENSDYSIYTVPQSAYTAESDLMYENLYEDEEDLAVPAKFHHNSEYGSIQDLIMQASRNQWQREIEEIRLNVPNKNRFN